VSDAVGDEAGLGGLEGLGLDLLIGGLVLAA